jgi:hypothetical protein
MGGWGLSEANARPGRLNRKRPITPANATIAYLPTLDAMHRHVRENAALVQFSGDCALDGEATNWPYRLAVYDSVVL